eukprot:6191576-Prymnesium_polylepis.1
MIPSSSYHLPSLKSISNVRYLQRALTAFAARSACVCWPVRVMCLFWYAFHEKSYFLRAVLLVTSQCVTHTE